MSKKESVFSKLTLVMSLAVPAVVWLLTVQLMARPRPGGNIDLIARAEIDLCFIGREDQSVWSVLTRLI